MNFYYTVITEMHLDCLHKNKKRIRKGKRDSKYIYIYERFS